MAAGPPYGRIGHAGAGRLGRADRAATGRLRCRTIRGMKGPPITVTCDCGQVEYVAYPATWTCPKCGRRWNTGQIPSEEYWAILKEQRGFRLEAMRIGALIGIAALILALLRPETAFLVILVAFGAWFLFYMPQWRKKVRRAARSVPRWNLTPE